MKPLVSVVVVNYNRAGLLRDCLHSLLRQSYLPLEIIMVDNGSTDGSLAAVASLPAGSVRTIQLDRNLGFGAANNIGFQKANGEFIALLNNDAIAQADWLERLMERALRNQSEGMWASRILLFNSEVIDKAGHLMFPDGQNRGKGTGEVDSGQHGREGEALFPDGCAALYRKRALVEAGGFDPDFFAYADDADLGLRIRILGWGCAYVPDAIVRHRHSSTSGAYSAEKILLVERNRLWLAVKNFPPLLLAINPLLTVYRWSWNALAAILKRGPAGNFRREAPLPILAVTIVRAYFQAITGIRPMLARRREIRRSRRLSDIALYRLLWRFRISALRLAFSDIDPALRTVIEQEEMPHTDPLTEDSRSSRM